MRVAISGHPEIASSLLLLAMTVFESYIFQIQKITTQCRDFSFAENYCLPVRFMNFALALEALFGSITPTLAALSSAC